MSQVSTDSILIVEDEQDVVDLLVYHLQKSGFKTLTAGSGERGLEKAEEHLPSLIILDIMLPTMEGMEVCRRLKADPKTARIPIMMLTAKAEEVDRVVGLELGADDYLTKPFSPREVVLRVKSILRRAKGSSEPTEQLQHNDLWVDRAKHKTTFKGKTIDLTSTEFRLLSLLMERRGRVQTRERLLMDVWDYSPDTDTRTIDTHIRRLREKLGKAGDFIETVRGVGYRFAD